LALNTSIKGTGQESQPDSQAGGGRLGAWSACAGEWSALPPPAERDYPLAKGSNNTHTPRALARFNALGTKGNKLLREFTLGGGRGGSEPAAQPPSPAGNFLPARGVYTKVCVCVWVGGWVCVLLLPFASLQGDSPVPRGGAVRAPLARVHSKLHQPPTTPCLSLASPAWWLHVPLCRCV
jgi:hypothetical protein